VLAQRALFSSGRDWPQRWREAYTRNQTAVNASDRKSDLEYLLKHGPLREAWCQQRNFPFVIISPRLGAAARTTEWPPEVLLFYWGLPNDRRTRSPLAWAVPNAFCALSIGERFGHFRLLGQEFAD
jgi:hypothetical protein